jgi:hypothetical protein
MATHQDRLTDRQWQCDFDFDLWRFHSNDVYRISEEVLSSVDGRIIISVDSILYMLSHSCFDKCVCSLPVCLIRRKCSGNILTQN